MNFSLYFVLYKLMILIGVFFEEEEKTVLILNLDGPKEKNKPSKLYYLTI